MLLVNGLVFYLGIRAVEGWAPTPGSPPVMQTPAMEVFQHLLRDMDTGALGALGSRTCRGWGLHMCSFAGYVACVGGCGGGA